jgi:CheY-like chemotaxis protein
VLIVDDDENIRYALRLLFEFEDFQVTEAASGPEAVARALRDDPGFVVLDYMMPGMTGEKTAGLLRSVVPDARIVAFSAILDDKPVWADAFLNKERISEIAPLLTNLVAEARLRP